MQMGLTMIDRALGIAGLAISTITLVVPSVCPSINRKVAWAGGAFGVLLLGAAGGIAFLPDGQAQSVPAGQIPIVNQGPGSAYSFGQQGGITAGTVNIAPPKRELSDPKALTLKNKMLTELSRDKPITVTALIGDAESIQFAQLDFGAFGEVKRHRTSALPDAAPGAWDFRRFVRVRAKLDNRPAIGSGSPPPRPTAPV